MKLQIPTTIDTDIIKQPSTWSAIVVLVTALSTYFTGEAPDPQLMFGTEVVYGAEEVSKVDPTLIIGAAAYFLINALWKQDTQSKRS